MNFRLTTRGVTVAAIGITALVVFIGVALAATSSARFCSACKSHVPYVDEWSASAHGDVNCEQCHTKPGPFFFLTSKLEALQQPIAQITGDYEEPILGFVLNQSCRRCHTNENLFKNVSSGGIIVNHEHLIEAGFLCQRCHSTTAHGLAVPEGSRTFPVMEQCLICHNNEFTAADGTVATSRCDQCHAERGYGAAPVSHDEPDWSARHGAVGVLSTCSACHVKKDACSRVPRGHSHASPRALALRARQVRRGEGAQVVRPVPQRQGVLQHLSQGAHAASERLHLDPPGSSGSLRRADLLQLSRAGQLPGLSRAACHRRPTSAQPVRRSRLHAAPADVRPRPRRVRGASSTCSRTGSPRAGCSSRAACRGRGCSASSPPSPSSSSRPSSPSRR